MGESWYYIPAPIKISLPVSHVLSQGIFVSVFVNEILINRRTILRCVRGLHAFIKFLSKKIRWMKNVNVNRWFLVIMFNLFTLGCSEINQIILTAMGVFMGQIIDLVLPFRLLRALWFFLRKKNERKKIIYSLHKRYTHTKKIIFKH